MYLVINPDGSHRLVNEPATLEAVRREVGPPGFDMVRVNAHDLRVFVNDEGLFDQETHPRNIPGGAVCVMAGAAPAILAGVVVVTGWDREADPEVADLPRTTADTLLFALGQVNAALSGGDTQLSAGWARTVRGYGEWARTAPTPVATVSTVNLDELLTARRSGRVARRSI